MKLNNEEAWLLTKIKKQNKKQLIAIAKLKEKQSQYSIIDRLVEEWLEKIRQAKE